MSDYKLICGNALDILKKGKEKSIQTCICSPPYFGLRDYQTASWQGGDEECEHTVSHYSDNMKPHVDRPFRGERRYCLKCGATRVDEQIGLENTVEEYVDHLVEVFREVRRMLRDDGTLWLNLGDSYNGSGGAGGDYGKGGLKEGQPKYPGRNLKGLGPKQLLGIPWRVALALQADGWILRQDIIWSKGNPMPESVKDRCTKSHEYIFLFSKNKKYFYDYIAIAEPAIYGNSWSASNTHTAVGQGGKHGKTSIFEQRWENTNGLRNKRSVWNVNTRPVKDAHFATFPVDLIEPMILAATSEHGCCKTCGKSYQRIVEKETTFEGGSGKAGRTSEDANQSGKWAGQQYGENIKLGPVTHTRTTGWKATCECQSDTVSSWVLDPFVGSGTTAVVALKNKRRFIGVDLNPDYIQIAEKRIQKEIYGK